MKKNYSYRAGATIMGLIVHAPTVTSTQ